MDGEDDGLFEGSAVIDIGGALYFPLGDPDGETLGVNDSMTVGKLEG